MKCPYRKTIVHQPEIREGDKIRFERQTEEFGECYESECPFFRTRPDGEKDCRKAAREENK